MFFHPIMTAYKGDSKSDSNYIRDPISNRDSNYIRDPISVRDPNYNRDPNSVRDANSVDLDLTLAEFREIRDHFTNVKFAYRERQSKFHFYSAIEEDSQIFSQLNNALLDASKENLTQVKKTYEEKDKNIEKTSEELHLLETEEEKLSQEKKRLLEEINALNSTINNLSTLKESVTNQSSIKDQLTIVKENNTSIQNNIDNMHKTLNSSEKEELLQKEKKSMNTKRELSKRVKRLTVVNTENDIEEIYYWQKAIQEIYKTALGEIEVISGDNNRDINNGANINNGASINRDINNSSTACELVLRNISTSYGPVSLSFTVSNKKLLDITPLEMPEKYIGEFMQLKEQCIKIDDPRILLTYFHTQR